MKKLLLLVIVFLSVYQLKAADPIPGWYILESGASVGIVKPGINDLIYYLQINSGKAIDKATIDNVNAGLNFAPGYPVLVYARVNNNWLATDMEGRTLVVKGKVTPAITGDKSGVGYVKSDMHADDGTVLKRGAYVWIKGEAADQRLNIQHADKKTVPVNSNALYVIVQTTADFIPNISFKNIQ